MMEQEKKSQGERVIEQLMAELDPDSERYRVLATAKRFKSTWVELGEQLLKVSRDGLFSQWGYSSFEEYCSREVRIRRQTAEKLTLAYRFLEKEEPQLLARHAELKPLPDYRSVDLLRQAREEQLPAERFAELRKAVIDDERSHPTVLKHYREATAATRPAAEEERQALQNALAAARRLSVALKALPQLAPAHADPIVQLVALLEERLETGQEA
jgi:hypothetical protein